MKGDYYRYLAEVADGDKKGKLGVKHRIKVCLPTATRHINLMVLPESFCCTELTSSNTNLRVQSNASVVRSRTGGRPAQDAWLFFCSRLFLICGWNKASTVPVKFIFKSPIFVPSVLAPPEAALCPFLPMLAITCKACHCSTASTGPSRRGRPGYFQTLKLVLEEVSLCIFPKPRSWPSSDVTELFP